MLGLLAVNEVEALGLDQLVDLGTGQGGNGLLGEAVADSLALGALVVLPLVHGGEAGAGAEKLMRQGALVVVVVVVDLVAGVARLVWRKVLVVFLRSSCVRSCCMRELDGTYQNRRNPL